MLLGRKAMTNLDSILKNRDITLPTKVRIVEAMVFTEDMYGCESWTIKKVECWRINAFQLVLDQTHESPLDYMEIQPINPKGNQSWIFIGRTDAEAETPILWPPDAKSWLIGKDWCCERLKAGGKGSDRGWWLDGIINSRHMNLSKLWRTVKDREVWHAAVHGLTNSQTQPRYLNDYYKWKVTFYKNIKK